VRSFRHYECDRRVVLAKRQQHLRSGFLSNHLRLRSSTQQVSCSIAVSIRPTLVARGPAIELATTSRQDRVQ